ncbi:hypothetical protein BCR35DRAFT_302457 [Leucosporidium creatinivorum]|uniref:Histidine kinase n=1 Tax=Leucosporidium creatinivorum TaxID=106004 RepID=A0A1Y2FU54_9BASI|nr:hypothetical protein BCR35DRAFT_302457 [Leucosporidium creatinivorum]
MAAHPSPPLPTPLVDFLSSYPHPCFALPASPLHAALTTRQTVGVSAASRDQKRRAKRAAGQGDTEMGSRSSGSMHTGSSHSKRSTAEEILSTAFGQQAHSAPDPSPPPTHSSLLEGGSQQSHHPSRTAEGAVAAMYEQRAVRKAANRQDRALEASLDEDKRVEREEREAVERQGGDKWGGATRNMDQGEGGDRGREGMGMNLEGLLRPVWANERWEQLVQRKEVKEGQDQGPEINLVSLVGRDDLQKLLALLVQVIAPSESADASSSTRSDNTISLTLKFPHYSVNYRSSRRRNRIAVPMRASAAHPNPDIKANAYNSTATSHSASSGSGASSVSSSVNVDAEYNLQLVATWMEKEDLVVITTIATNIFPSSASSRKRPSTRASTASSASRPQGAAARPVLSPQQPLPSPNTSRPTRPTSSDASHTTSAVPPSPKQLPTTLPPIMETSSSTSSDGKIHRPSLPRQVSRESGSSAVTVQPLPDDSVSSAPTPTPSHPGTRAPSHSSSSLPSPTFTLPSSGAPSPSIPATTDKLSPPLPTDQVPTPIPDYTGKPLYDPEVDAEAARAAALLLGRDTEIIDPHKAFLVERRKRRKAKRDRERKKEGLEGVTESGTAGKAGEERELTHEEEKKEGAREREARKWKEEQDARDEAELDELDTLAEQSEREELDEKMDRELDALRAGSDLESSNEEGKIHSAFGRAEEDDDSDDDDGRAENSGGLQDDSTDSPASDGPPSPLSAANLQVQQRAAMLDPFTTPESVDNFLDIISRTPTGRLIAAHAWENTSLGGIRYWTPELRSMVMISLASPFRSSLWWGEDSVLIYNDEYARMLGQKHPHILGVSGAVGWSELWDTLGPLAARVMQGETVSYFDHHLPMLRNGFLEETYHTWSFVPFRNRDGIVVGYENTSFETTARVIAERRLATMRDLAQMTQLARTSTDYFQKALQIVATNPLDLPFALLYSCETATPTFGKRTAGSSDQGGSKSRADTNNTSANSAQIKLVLQGTVGVPEGHPSAPAEFTTRIDTTPPSQHEPSLHGTSDTSSNTSHTGTGTNSATNSSQPTGSMEGEPSWPFQEACSSRKPVFLADLFGRAKGFHQRGWPSEVKHGVVIPIVVEGDTTSIPKACLVLGLNPRRPWNEVFATFLNLLSKSLSTGLLNVTMAETEAQRTEELLQLDKAKTSFFANTSHEIRTPLTLILGPLEDVLSSTTLRTEDREKLLIVQRHSNRLLNMVNTLLDFSRLEGGRMDTVFRPVKLGTMVADLSSLFRAAIERGGIELLVDCQPDPFEDKPVYLAAELFEKVLFNLLGNAFKYTLKGQITVKVSYEGSAKALVQVIDTGCGIADHELAHIFDRFHRVESNSRTAGGTGIGLALTLELVKTLGGKLDVESAVNQGSTFTVTLRRGHAHLPAAQVVEEALEPVDLPPRAQNSLSIIEDAASWKVHPQLSASLSQPGQPASPSMAFKPALDAGLASAEDPFVLSADLLDLRNSTILLVDDNADLRQYIGALLGRAFRVVEMEDGQAALEYCLREPPSLVVSDVMMPRLDGAGLLNALRSNPSTALIPVLFLSAQAGPEARVEALLSGVDDYLVKPFQGKELLARVNSHLQLGKMRMELERRVEERTRALIESEVKYRGLADRYSTLSLLSPVGIFMADPFGRVNYANPRFYDISGVDPDGSLADWRSSIMDEYQANVEKVWKEATALKPKHHKPAAVATTMEFRWKKDQNWVLFEIRPFSESGIHRGFVGSITDISSQKRVEQLHIQEVERRAADAEENRRQTDQFLDMSSHELRNPLSGVWQNAQVVGDSLEKFVELLEELQEGNVPDEQTLDSLLAEMEENVESIESIILCASHQQRIADDILNVSKLNMGLLSINPVAFDLAAKVQEVVHMFMVECQQKAIKLTLRKGDSLKQLKAETVVADPGRLNQCLINFVTNGVKYTTESKRRLITIHLDAFPSAPPQPERAMRVINKNIAVDTPADPETVWIMCGVEDSGKGLTQDELKKLFARFSQANPKSDQYGGSGLGLYVSKKLVELHNGFIEVESTPGQGSTFRFAIPTKRLAAGTKLAPSPPAPPSSSTSSRRTKSRPGSSSGPVRAPSASGPVRAPAASAPVATPAQPELPSTEVEKPPISCHVLVVEDNLINSRVLTRQLKIAGHEVSVAFDGQQGLDLIAKDCSATDADHRPIEVVLMDIEMPVMDGLTAIKELRKREASGEIPRRYPCIAVTGNARQAQIDHCLEAGFDNVTIKPYDRDAVLNLIQLAVEGRLREAGGVRKGSAP